jgi:hypothetical protein
MKKSFRQGLYTPRNPEKYLGDLTQIEYRSSWELHAFQFLDNNIKVRHWISEGVAIQYMKPVSPQEDPRGFRPARYFPDLFIVYELPDGTIQKEMIEIKPEKQTKPSKSRNTYTRLLEDYTYAVNQAKWQAAITWCNQRGIKFSVLTEKSLFKM